MSHTYTISTDILELESINEKSVTIKNRRRTNPIIFDEKVVFNESIEYNSIKLGSYVLKVDDNDNFVIEKNGSVIFTLNQ